MNPVICQLYFVERSYKNQIFDEDGIKTPGIGTRLYAALQWEPAALK